jgi:PAS domain S-box-containing protein
MKFQQKILFLSLVGAAPWILLSAGLLWWHDHPALTWQTVVVIGGGITLLASAALWSGSLRRLQSVTSLLAGLREGDFSIQGSSEFDREDPMGEVFAEISELARALRQRRLASIESEKLLAKVVGQIEVAVLTFDEKGQLRTINPCGTRLLGKPAADLIGRTALDLGLDQALQAEADKVIRLDLEHQAERLAVRRGVYREEGRQHQLLILTDVSEPLKQEEMQAWKRLIRVIGHEVHNSMTPIKVMVDGLDMLLRRSPPPEDWQATSAERLGLVSERIDRLSGFIEMYSSLAKVPKPRLVRLDVGTLVRDVAALEDRVSVRVEAGPDSTIQGDRSQLEQVLINLVRNSAEAVEETGGSVWMQWRRNEGKVTIEVVDEGVGIADPVHLFVPSFSTKPQGNGIGLALSRQIVEGHKGTIELTNRLDGPGARASVRLPAGS